MIPLITESLQLCLAAGEMLSPTAPIPQIGRFTPHASESIRSAYAGLTLLEMAANRALNLARGLILLLLD